MLRWLLLVGVIACGCGDAERTPKPQPEPPVQATQTPLVNQAALAAFQRFECNRCHAGLDLPTPALDKQCVGCHREILAGTFEATPELLATWKSHVTSLPVAPSLSAVGKKFTRAWVIKQLQGPIDTRPGLLATMPRLRISEAEATLMAQSLVPSESAAQSFPKASVDRGQAIYARLGCAGCHAFGMAPALGKTEVSEHDSDALALAPDLRHTRERFQSGQLVAWLMNPQAIEPETRMPSFALSKDDATSLASYLWHAETKAPKQTVPPRLPVLTRKVRFDEVSAQVFRKVCWHCHSSPDYARGDGGPGNTGGFGFAARGLDLSTYEGVRSGSFGDDGRRRSIFVRDEKGVSLLVRVMLLRQAEEAGVVAEQRGMPLGFPSMSPQQIQLVESWIEQGRPR